MSEATRFLEAIQGGDLNASDDLFQLVYDELRRLAARKMQHEGPGQTLQATALVHEAYLRLVGPEADGSWQSSRHFFGAAANAMRCILINRARDKRRLKRGGGVRHIDLDHLDVAADAASEELEALDEAIAGLRREDPMSAELVELRYFAGLPHAAAADVLGMSRRSADRCWAFARAWLYDALRRDSGA